MRLNCRPSPGDIIYDNLIPDELGRGQWPVLDFGQLILGVQRVGRGPRGQEPLALWLRPLYIAVAQVVLGFVQLEVEGPGAGTCDVPVLPLELWPVQISRQLPRLCPFMKVLDICASASQHESKQGTYLVCRGSPGCTIAPSRGARS